jgi:hypothetical protein
MNIERVTHGRTTWLAYDGLPGGQNAVRMGGQRRHFGLAVIVTQKQPAQAYPLRQERTG